MPFFLNKDVIIILASPSSAYTLLHSWYKTQKKSFFIMFCNFQKDTYFLTTNNYVTLKLFQTILIMCSTSCVEKNKRNPTLKTLLTSTITSRYILLPNVKKHGFEKTPIKNFKTAFITVTKKMPFHRLCLPLRNYCFFL